MPRTLAFKIKKRQKPDSDGGFFLATPGTLHNCRVSASHRRIGLRGGSGEQGLTDLSFTPEMARFDCLMTVKIIVDELYDEFNVGHAQEEWYREYLKLAKY